MSTATSASAEQKGRHIHIHTYCVANVAQSGKKTGFLLRLFLLLLLLLLRNISSHIKILRHDIAMCCKTFHAAVSLSSVLTFSMYTRHTHACIEGVRAPACPLRRTEHHDG